MHRAVGTFSSRRRPNQPKVGWLAGKKNHPRRSVTMVDPLPTTRATRMTPTLFASFCAEGCICLLLDSAPADVAANLTFLAVGGGCSDLQGRPELASTNVCVRDLDLAAFNVPDGRLGVVADGLTLFQLAIDTTLLVSPLAKLVWYCEELSKNLQRLFAFPRAVPRAQTCTFQGPGLQKHQTPKRKECKLWWAREKKERNFGRVQWRRGSGGGGRVRRRGGPGERPIFGRPRNLDHTPTHHTRTTTQYHDTPHNTMVGPALGSWGGVPAERFWAAQGR